MNKYTYIAEFLSKESSPDGSKVHSFTTELGGKKAEARSSFARFVKKHGLIAKGTLSAGDILNIKGDKIGKYGVKTGVI
jgi:hypothetical protein